MICTRRRLHLCATLLVCNLIFIWGNSLLPGEISGAISQWVKDMISGLFPGDSDPQGGHGLLRKLAHFTEFTGLGMCLCWLISMLGKRPWYSLIGGFLAACVDETIQRFVPDRGPSLRDVLIDTSGVILGVILLLTGHAMIQAKRKKRRNVTNEKTDFPDAGADNAGCRCSGLRR
jgi:VanZ family protein